MKYSICLSMEDYQHFVRFAVFCSVYFLTDDKEKQSDTKSSLRYLSNIFSRDKLHLVLNLVFIDSSCLLPSQLFSKRKNTLDLLGFSKLFLSDSFSLCGGTYTEFITRKVAEFFDKINANISIQNA